MASFFDEIAEVAARGPRFFVPGHKGNPGAIPPFASLLQYDLTEVAGAYDLGHPEGALADSQALMARVYGAGASLYSTFGSTSCVQAMLALFVGAGEQVVMARGCHVSALRALAFLDAEPVWVPLQGGAAPPQAIEAALVRSGARAVYLTSPDFYGRMADIAAVAAVCRRQGAALLVDNAHGAYLRFWPGPGGKSLHPMDLGADACADSAHKTLACLTPAALLHLRDAGLAQAGRDALNLFCSTSPAYPVLLSLDLAARRLSQAPPDFVAAGQKLRAAAAGFAQVVRPCTEPLKLVLEPGLAGVEAAAFHTALLEQGIAPEYYDGQVLVLMASPWNTDADFEALHDALQQLSHTFLHNNRHNNTENSRDKFASPAAEPAGTLPEVVLRPRQALLAPKLRLPVAGAAGRVCAGLVAPCPPGVPLVVPGERITPALAAQLAAGGILQVDVVK